MKIRVIKSHDLQIFRNVCLRTAQSDMKKIKFYFDKEDYHLVTNVEAAEYFGVSLEDFEAIIHKQFKK